MGTQVKASLESVFKFSPSDLEDNSRSTLSANQRNRIKKSVFKTDLMILLSVILFFTCFSVTLFWYLKMKICGVFIFSVFFILTVGRSAKSLKDFSITYLDYRNHWENGQVFAFTFNQSDLKSDGGIYYIIQTEHTTVELSKKEYAILEPKQEYTLYYFSYKGSCRPLSITAVE